MRVLLVYPRRNMLNGESRLSLTAESGEVLKRFDAWKEEVGTALYGRESGQALYLLADRTLWNRKVKRAVLRQSSDRARCRARENSGRLPKRSAQTRIGERDLRRSRTP